MLLAMILPSMIALYGYQHFGGIFYDADYMNLREALICRPIY
jgi:hypothetical protein